MTRWIIAIVLGAVLFGLGAWYWELFNTNPIGGPKLKGQETEKVADKSVLGGDLYKAEEFPEIKLPKFAADRPPDPVVLYGIMNPRDQEEVSTQVNGRILFIGEEVD